jgi:hypothetical protein
MEAASVSGTRIAPIILAESLAGAGRSEEAMTELEKPPECPEADYFFYLRDSPVFDELRDTPRFRAVYRPFE